MDAVMLYVGLGRKLLAGVALGVAVWLVVAVPAALVLGRVLADTDSPTLDDDEEAGR